MDSLPGESPLPREDGSSGGQVPRSKRPLLPPLRPARELVDGSGAMICGDDLRARAATIVDVYGGGPLEQEGTHRLACCGAVVCIAGTTVLPVALAYLAGRHDGMADPFSGGVVLPIMALGTAALLVACEWACCCAWNKKLGCRDNVLGSVVSMMVGGLVREDQHDPQHVQAVVAAVRKLELQGATSANPASLMKKLGVSRDHITIPSTTGGQAIPVRLYRPAASTATTPTAAPLPLFVYLHGGGWSTGGTGGNTFDSAPSDAACCTIAAKVKCLVAFVDYRKAPLHKFPCAPDDCLDALRHLISPNTAAALNIDTQRVAVGGDSAGGNLTCVLAQDALKEGIDLSLQLLIYPVRSHLPLQIKNRLLIILLSIKSVSSFLSAACCQLNLLLVLVQR